MSAADWMVVRTGSGVRAVPRRAGLAMIAARRAQVVTQAEAAAEHARVQNRHAQRLAERAAVADAHEAGGAVVPPAPERPSTGQQDPVPPTTDPDVDESDGAELQAAADELAATPTYHELPTEPRGNAGREEWATYARSLGVEVTDDMGRNKIRDAAQDVAQSLDRLPQPALTGGRLETPEDEPAAEGAASEDPGTR